MENKERNYVAFISYRHLPLDMAIAEELQNLIEHYRIPKDLRKDGESSLGLAFRDRVELPLSSNLTEDIYTALDNSRFLIVVCTPDTPKSRWVTREIEYFIKRHGRDRILTVHAAGSPTEAIPPQITHIYDEEGRLTEIIEPLSAFLAGSSEKRILSNLKREFLRVAAAILDCPYDTLVRQEEYRRPRKVLKREFLRLVAAILGCPYDALIQRNKRYLYQRLMAFTLAAALVLLIFSGIVIGKNVQISGMNTELSDKNSQIVELLQKSQLQESQALTALSRQQLEEGDRMAAIRSALSALPSADAQRPFDPDAVGALADALNLYADNGTLMTHSRMELTGETVDMAISGDCRYAVSLDAYDMLKCQNILSGETLWNFHHNENPLTPEEEVELSYLPASQRGEFLFLEFSNDSERILHATTKSTCVISTQTGEHLFTLDYPYTLHVMLSPDDRYLAVCTQQDTVSFYDAATGQQISSAAIAVPEAYRIKQIEPLCFRTDGDALLVKICYVQTDGSDTGNVPRFVTLDPETGKTRPYSDSDFTFSQVFPMKDGGFLFFQPAARGSSSMVRLDGTGNILFQQELDLVLPSSLYAKPFWNTLGDRVYICGQETKLYAFDLNTGTLLLDYELDEDILEGFLSDTGNLTLFYDDGTVEYHSIRFYSDRIYLEPVSVLNTGHPVSSAAYPRNGAAMYCLLPSQYDTNSSAQFVTIQENSAVLYLPDDAPSSQSVTLFPSGSAFFLGYDNQAVNADSLQVIQFPVVPQDAGDFCGFTADGSKLIYSGGVTLDLNTGNVEEIELWYELPDLTENYAPMVTNAGRNIFYNEVAVGWERIFTQRPGEALLSAVYHEERIHWWLDDVHYESSPCPYTDAMECVEETTDVITGENGLILIRIPAEEVWSIDHFTGISETAAYVVYSIEEDAWYWLDFPFVPGAQTGYIPTAYKKWIACMDQQNNLYLVDPASGSVVQQLTVPFSANAVSSMHFLEEDKVLLAILDTGYSYFIDISTGEELLSHVYTNSSYDKTIQIDETNRRLFLSGSHSTDGIIVDMENWTLIREVSNLRGYLSGSNTLIRFDNTANQLALCPACTLEQMQILAEEILAGK